MNDTTPEIAAEMTKLFQQRSMAERLEMVCEMFDLARALMIADIRRSNPDIDDSELRGRICQRLYGDER